MNPGSLRNLDKTRISANYLLENWAAYIYYVIFRNTSQDLEVKYLSSYLTNYINKLPQLSISCQ